MLRLDRLHGITTHDKYVDIVSILRVSLPCNCASNIKYIRNIRMSKTLIFLIKAHLIRGLRLNG